MSKMWRVRFKANCEDPRPVTFPPSGPWWESGFAADESYSIIVAYMPKKSDLKKYWPEAWDEEWEQVDKITYSSRFPKPEWYKP